jgi:hypothetical protein
LTRALETIQAGIGTAWPLRDGCATETGDFPGRVDSVPGGWYKEPVTRAHIDPALIEGGFEQAEKSAIALHPPMRPAPGSEAPDVP